MLPLCSPKRIYKEKAGHPVRSLGVRSGKPNLFGVEDHHGQLRRVRSLSVRSAKPNPGGLAWGESLGERTKVTLLVPI